MDNAKLRNIIDAKNDQIERQVTDLAASLITEIVKEQQNITRAEERIAELRADLKALEVKAIDPKAVLGE